LKGIVFKTSTVHKKFIIMDDLVAQRYRTEQIRPDDDRRKVYVEQSRLNEFGNLKGIVFKTSTVHEIFIIMDDLVAQRYRAEQIRPDDD
jgi:hypothetical protein